MNKVATNEKVMAGVDFNDHVGSDMGRVFQIPNSVKGWRVDEFHPLPQWGRTKNFSEGGYFVRYRVVRTCGGVIYNSSSSL